MAFWGTMKILIADDEVGLGRLFKIMFSDKMPDSQVDVVISGVEAEDLFRNSNYDVVLLDVSMHEKNGYDVCVEIQGICRERNSKMPFIIFYSGYGASEEIELLLEDKSGYAFLRKPVTSAQIMAAIEEIQK